MKKPQIYSVGYENIDPTYLVELSQSLGAVVIDVRARMSRVKAGFGRRQLETLLGDNYQWRGDILGGFGQDTTEGRRWLADFDKPSILLCKEYWPGDCHRHQTIAAPMLNKPLKGAEKRMVLHLFEGALIRTDELGADGEPLDDTESLSFDEHLASLK